MPSLTILKRDFVRSYYRSPEDDPALLELLTQIARAQGLQRKFEKAHQTLDQVKRRLGGVASRPQIRHLLERGRVFNSSGDPIQSRPFFEQALDLATQLNEDFYVFIEFFFCFFCFFRFYFFFPFVFFFIVLVVLFFLVLILIAARNPCPCGKSSDPEAQCTCDQAQVEKYRRRISGPLLDRIDLHIEVPRVKCAELFGEAKAESSASVRERVQRARDAQAARFRGSSTIVNAEMNQKFIKRFCTQDGEAASLLKSATERLKLSARAYYRVLKVASTIADLDGEPEVAPRHVAEALQFRERQG